MLDKGTLGWLEVREDSLYDYGGYYCRHCKYFNEAYDPFYGHCATEINCPIIDNDYRDVAEFDNRVIEKLAVISDTNIPCMSFDEMCPYGKNYWYDENCEAACKLKMARLWAEEEEGEEGTK